MHLSHLEIRNFRSIKSLSLELKDGGNLLVGPNAVGKSTVLEAIRLAKALLAPRTNTENRHVLTWLGAMSATGQTNFGAIAGDHSKPIVIKCTYSLIEEELKALPDMTKEIAQSLVAAQQGIDLTGPNGQLSLQQLLSTPVGKATLSQALQTVQEPIQNILKTKVCKLFVTLDGKGNFGGEDIISQLLFSLLERRLPPGRTMFSYFPADRALNTGDAQIQIGSADSQQQLESHNSQPSLKYQRLKNVIFSTILMGNEAANEQAVIFQKIFANLLKEKSLGPAEVSRIGQATVLINDSLDGRSFDIDAMSSGEKGLILTFLLISRTVEKGGLVLLDEPELHLNSGVCKNLLDFLLDELTLKDQIQVILCTHSPEIMTAALRREDCSVFNMRRDAPASRIRASDQAEAIQALKQLGTSEIEALLYDAVVFVEGPDDVELLEYAFRDLLSRIKFKELTGRGEVEKYIKQLIQSDRQKKADSTTLFMFDRDNKPTALQSTEHVKLKQWERYCLENYLIEPETRYDVVRQDFRPKQWPSTFGEAEALFKSFSRKQLKGRIVEEVFREQQLQDIRLRSEDKKEEFAQAASSLFGKVERLRTQVALWNGPEWTAAFGAACEQKLEATERDWHNTWIDRCNGKQFLVDVYSYAQPKGDLTQLKRALLAQHRSKNTAGWQALTKCVNDLVALIK